MHRSEKKNASSFLHCALSTADEDADYEYYACISNVAGWILQTKNKDYSRAKNRPVTLYFLKKERDGKILFFVGRIPA